MVAEPSLKRALGAAREVVRYSGADSGRRARVGARNRAHVGAPVRGESVDVLNRLGLPREPGLEEHSQPDGRQARRRRRRGVAWRLHWRSEHGRRSAKADCSRQALSVET